MPEELERQRLLIGAVSARLISGRHPADIESAELRVYSQFGEDGILQFVLSSFDDAVPKTFVEFGVEDYREANTRLLLEAQGWRGLVIDADPTNVRSIQSRPDFWRLPLTAICAFVDRDNINQLILSAGVSGHIGVLSVDIDGNDYWLWDAIDCIKPDIVVAEYNALFGPTSSVSIPYTADFRRFSAHYSGQYWGCSLSALEYLGRKKGYRLIGVNSDGVNAFFVRADAICSIATRKVADAFREVSVQQARLTDGRLSRESVSQTKQAIGHLPLIDVTTGRTTTLSALDSSSDH